MMKAAPTASFVVAQAEFLLQFLVIPFDDPAMFGQLHQFLQGSIGRQGGQPVFGGFGFPLRPFDQQPFFRMRFGSPVVAMRGTHPHGGKAGLQFLLHSLAARSLSSRLRRAATEQVLSPRLVVSSHRAVAVCGAVRCCLCVPAAVGSSPGFQTVTVVLLDSHDIGHLQFRQFRAEPLSVP